MHVDDLGGLEVLQATYRRQTFSRHSHEGFCVGVIDDGAQRFYRTGGEHVAPLGSIILVNADDIHTGSSATEEGWSYQAMYPTPELLAFLSRDLKTGAGATPYFPNPVVHDVGLAGQLRMAFSLLRSDENRLMKETMVFSALTWLMLRHGKSRIDPTPQSRAQSQVARVKAFSTISRGGHFAAGAGGASGAQPLLPAAAVSAGHRSAAARLSNSGAAA